MVYRPTVEKQEDTYVNVTIPMMRITNAIKVNLTSGGFDETTNPEDYNLIIHFPQGNGTIDFTGTVLPYEELRYRSLRKSLVTYIPGTPTEPGGVTPEDTRSDIYKPQTTNHKPQIGTRADGNGAQYAVCAEFGVSRLLVDDDSSLQIYDSNTGDLITEVPEFSKFLATAFDYNTQDSAQEFLDREYNFEVTLNLGDNGKITWIDLYLEVVGWYVRIRDISL